MYQRDNSVLLRSNASALTKNVAVLTSETSEDFQLNIAVIHKSSINIVKPNAEQGVTGMKEIVCKDSTHSGSDFMVIQVKWCNLYGKNFLVIAYQRGVHIFDWNGSVLLFWHVFTNAPDTEKKEMFARGITTCGKSLICVGTFDGQILVFDVPESGTNIAYVGSLKRDSSSVAIADLTSQDNLLISADVNGILTVWKNESFPMKQALNITSNYNDSCSVVACWKNIIISGHSNGMLRLYDLYQGSLIAEVSAHTKWISGLDIASISGIVCSASEDSYIRVWQVTPGKKPSIRHRYSVCIQDMPLCGVAFSDSKGGCFYTAAYDENELMCYSM